MRSIVARGRKQGKEQKCVGEVREAGREWKMWTEEDAEERPFKRLNMEIYFSSLTAWLANRM